jgi:hypothetical protein
MSNTVEYPEPIRQISTPASKEGAKSRAQKVRIPNRKQSQSEELLEIISNGELRPSFQFELIAEVKE